MVVSSHSSQELYLVAPRPGSWTWHKLHPDKIEQRSRFRTDRHMCSILAHPQSCLPWPILYTEFRGLGFHQKKELRGINGDVQPRAGNRLAELTPYLLLLCWFLVL